MSFLHHFSSPNDVFVLRRFVSTSEQKDDSLTVPGEIQAVSRPMMATQFVQPATKGFLVAKIPRFDV